MSDPAAKIETLSERERQVLRLLLRGHTAKSIATELDLSVHTVNDYLREARKKLGVGSSKAAARFLEETERSTPKKIAPDEIGIAKEERVDQNSTQSVGHKAVPILIGVVAIMLISILAITLFGTTSDDPNEKQSTAVIALAADDKAVRQGATSWLKLIDHHEWQSSWFEASNFVQKATTETQWIESIRRAREMTGTVVSRELTTISAHSELPGVPPGEYRIVQFSTGFTRTPAAIEVVTLIREDGSWKVAGYYIR